MNKLRYQIESANDRDGKKKDVAPEIKFRQYFIFFMNIGQSALLIDENGKTLSTSKVEGISIFEQGIKLTTKNTEYYLSPYVVEEK